MRSRKIVIQETVTVAIGQLICCAVMVGIFALLSKLDSTVILGALAGGLLATGNFFVMALCADLAADKGEAQDVKGGQALIQMSYLGRLAALFVILALCAKSGYFHVLTLVLPLVFTRPILTVTHLRKEKGGNVS